ncbi:MAG: AAA family ATPase [Gallionella sp.]
MKNKTDDVFGVKSTLVLSYVERELVDTRFKAALSSSNEVVVYGSSKQGKTSLILKHLPNQSYVKVECSPQTKPIDIYKSILRQLNIRYIDAETTEIGAEHGGKIGAGFKVRIPFLGDTGANAEVSDKNLSKTTRSEQYVEYNLSLAQDLSELLNANKCNRFIVLENFHYLSIEVQEALAYDLRIFQDHHIVFIILGIWREANRLAQFNGDLLDRITEVPVEPWERGDFLRVIAMGEPLLNVDFSKVSEMIIEESFDSVGVVQEICKLCCLNAGVLETADSRVTIEQTHLDAALAQKSKDYGARHIRSFESFVDIRVRTSTQSGKPSLAYPYYFINLLLTQKFEDIQKGLSRAVLLEEIRRIHHRPDDVRSSDLGAFLHNITQHQIGKKIQPPFVDYDRGGKVMKIIDSSLYFFLKNCNREDILADIPNPIDDLNVQFDEDI